MAFVYFILPLPPVPWWSMTESEARSGLGKEVHKFLISNENAPQKRNGGVEQSEIEAPRIPRGPLSPPISVN
jgi:hypothetical protein